MLFIELPLGSAGYIYVQVSHIVSVTPHLRDDRISVRLSDGILLQPTLTIKEFKSLLPSSCWP